MLYIVGDSVMKGIVYSEEEGKYKFAKGMKFRELEEEGTEVCNLSRMGATVDKGYSILTGRISGNHEGDTIILSYGGNDCDYNWREISEAPSGGIVRAEPHTTIEEFYRVYRSCIEYARALGARVMLTTLVPLDDKKYMNWISRGLSREKILSWLGSESMLYRWHEFYNSAVEKIAVEEECELIDIRKPFLLSHNYSSLMCADGIHPTEEGYKAVEDTITCCMRRTLVGAV